MPDKGGILGLGILSDRPKLLKKSGRAFGEQFHLFQETGLARFAYHGRWNDEEELRRYAREHDIREEDLFIIKGIEIQKKETRK